MKLSFNIEIDDVMAFYSNHYDTDPAYNKRKKFWWISPILLVCLGLFYYLRDKNWISLIIFGTLALVWVLIVRLTSIKFE